jgi:hypothetical protein
LARILKLDPKDLCQAAIYEFHPLLYATIFGTDPPPPPAEAPVNGSAGFRQRLLVAPDCKELQ